MKFEQFLSKVKEKLQFNDSIDDLVASCHGDDFLVPACCACYRAVEQALHLTPYDEQLLAGLALYEGKIVQMNTGEGKTLSAVFAAFYNYLDGKKVHILTFNDYLAERDYKWMKPIYNLLQVDVDYIVESETAESRREAYEADVVYLTAKESGFDFLKDFVAQSTKDIVQPPLNVAIVDEVDSVLIDEARIPLVVAGNFDAETDEDMVEITKFVKQLAPSMFEISEETQNVFLTDNGIAVAEEHYKLENLFDEVNASLLTKINDCLKANYLLMEDKHYIVKDDELQIIDEFTGRTAKNRHYVGTLQAAVELKHNLKPTSRGTIMGSVPMQFFIQQYRKLSGMSGTAILAKDEFDVLYDLPVVTIENHEPCVRIDHKMQIYLDRETKIKAIVEAVLLANKKGQPVLIGTSNISDGEYLTQQLTKRGISNVNFLSAKNNSTEAEIIKYAGAFGAVTVSANMAGRGVDIRLGGYNEETREQVVEAGGLLIIGTQLEESGRINAQLNGRAGRQGDVGETRLFVALDDEIMELYRLKGLIPSGHYPKNTTSEITDKVVIREVQRIQRISEGDMLDKRERLLKFTQIGEKHRDITFNTRKKFLIGERTADLWQQHCAENYQKSVEKFGENAVSEYQKSAIISAFNYVWCDYLEYTSGIRQGIHLARIGGKNPTDEFNIVCEEYFGSMEDRIILYMTDVLTNLLKNEEFKLKLPSKIWTYFLDDGGDELIKKQFKKMTSIVDSYDEEQIDSKPTKKHFWQK